jgi:hypothetical protein
VNGKASEIFFNIVGSMLVLIIDPDIKYKTPVTPKATPSENLGITREIPATNIPRLTTGMKPSKRNKTILTFSIEFISSPRFNE